MKVVPVHEPFNGREFVWIRRLLPSLRRHTTVVVPSGATTTSGVLPLAPEKDKLSAMPQAPLPCLMLALIMKSLPSCSRQTTLDVPFAEAATSG